MLTLSQKENDLISLEKSANNKQLQLPITKREEEVLTLLALGKANKEISRELKLSFSTVRNHISKIFLRLNVSNRSQATALAIYAGLLDLNALVQSFSANYPDN